MRVLVVDDSITFRSQIKRALGEVEGVELVGSASNGRLALQMLEQNPVDLMILDLNMPVMSGLDLLEQLRPRSRGLDVIVFAGRTERSAEDTMKALSLGAGDFVVKPTSVALDFEAAYLSIADLLVPKVRQFLKPKSLTPMVAPPKQRIAIESLKPSAVVIASSTGGPGALESVFKNIGGTPHVPIFIAQHMPETFTRYLAARIKSLSGIECREAVHGETVVPGVIYVAPGDYHMQVVPSEVPGRVQVALDRGGKMNGVRPAADLLFESAAKVYGSRCLALVLTGMGQDGLIGCKAVKKAGGAVLIQDQASSVVWGMPGAVYVADLWDKVASLEDCGRVLSRVVVRERVAG